MKLIRETPNELTMQARPYFAWLIAKGAALCGIVVLLLANWATFDCSRDLSFPTQGTCTLTYYNWVISRQRSWSLAQITEAHTEVRTVKSRSYHVFLTTTSEKVELPFDSLFPDKPKATAADIQNFLTNSQRSSLKQLMDNRPTHFGWFILSEVVAGVLGIIGKMVTLEINKQTQTLTWQRRNLLGTRTIEYRLDQITDVIVQEKHRPNRQPLSRLLILLKDGKQLIVNPYDYIYIAAVARGCAQRIRRFLDLQ